MSTRMNFGTIIATFTPLDNSIAPIQYQADTTFDEEEFLSEPQPAKERGRRFMSNNGFDSTTIHRYASNGTRDFSVFDGPIAKQLEGWAEQNPTVHFNLDFSYQLEEQDSASIVIQRHLDAFFSNTPARVISNDVAVIKFTLNYGKLQNIDGATGQPVA